MVNHAFSLSPYVESSGFMSGSNFLRHNIASVSRVLSDMHPLNESRLYYELEIRTSVLYL